jgi:opacity protein-like surface antigen
MKHVLAVVALAVVVALVAAPAAMAQTKMVRGTVVSVTGDTLVVKVAGQDMTFKVDKATEVQARGAGTAQRKAEAAGAPGVKFTDFVKAGEGAEVTYKEAGGVMTATFVRAGLPPVEGKAPEAEAPQGSVKGAISAVTGTSVSVNTGDKVETFAIDAKTLMLGPGLGTITKKFQADGKAPSATDLLKVNDQVVVSYKEEAGVKKASEIRVMQKAMK